MQSLLSEQMLSLFAILAIGSLIAQLSWRGVTLGAAGVLFTALVFGHFGFSVPKEVMDLGLLLFVYAVGISAGPRFFRTFRNHGRRFAVIAAAVALTGALATVIVALLFDLPHELAAGLYTGALTCTPALAAAVDVLERLSPGSSGLVSVGYGVAYPFSMIGVVLLVQFMPRILNKNVKTEEHKWLREKRREEPELEVKQFRITNPNIDGQTVSQVNPHRLAQANISRIKHGERVSAAAPDIVLHLDDVVMVVGSAEELDKLRLLLGAETQERMDVNTTVLSMDTEVTEEAMTGKTLAQMRLWERYTVVITRIRRQGLEIAPAGDVTLEMGDSLRVVGDRDAVEAFVKLVHGGPRKAAETNMVPFLSGLLLGILVGLIPIPLPNGMSMRLGMAGGAFLVSLIIGHFGKIGPFRLYVPNAARNILREFGLMLFLAGAGTTAGAHFVEILGKQGWQLLLAGALITILSAAAGIFVMHRIYRMNLLSTMGALCASMTNPPGLGAANAQTETDLPALSYASVYPVALIFKILIAQFLVEVLRRMPLLLAALLLTSCALFSNGDAGPTASVAPSGPPTHTPYPEPQEDGEQAPTQIPASPTNVSYPAPGSGAQSSPTSSSAGYPAPQKNPTATSPASYPAPQSGATSTSPAAYPGPQQTTPAVLPTREPTVTVGAVTVAVTDTPTPTSSPTPAFTPTATPTRTASPTAAYTPTPSWTAPPLPEGGFRDEFDWEMGKNWKWYYPDEEYVSLTLSPGFLRIYPQSGGLPDGQPRNLFLANAPEGDFEISTMLSFNPNNNYQFAGLVVYSDLRNALQFGIGFAECADPLNCLGRALYFNSFQDGAPGSQTVATLDGTEDQVYLRILRQGKNYRAEYSLDALNWIEAGVLTNPLEPIWVGLFTGQFETGYDPEVYALFDYFSLNLLP